ncbi:MAG: VOC family protein [Actinomycetota bacterium]|nr:VOC family protein [Actinomycetota bacterium]
MFEQLVAMTVIAASDLSRARRFWHDVLARDPVYSDEGGDIYDVGGAAVHVYESGYAGTAQNTVLSFITDDLDRDMEALRSRGVVFHDYDLPGLKTIDGIAEIFGERAAWFSDSEGNIMAIEEPSPGRLEQVTKMRAGIADRP